MTSPIAGGVDCDLHPAVPHLTSLLPYLNDYWRDQVTTRGMTERDMDRIGELIARALQTPDDEAALGMVKAEVEKLMSDLRN